MKVVGLSGAQGAGKSSMLLELKSRGWQLDEFRVSRVVQAQLGWESLDRVMDSPQTMMEFQNEVFRQKFINDTRLSSLTNFLDDLGYVTPTDKSSIVLTERTFADICAYTNLWTWRFVDSNRLSLSEAIDFLTEFTHKCAKAQATYSATMLLPLMNHMAWENDPNRADFKDADTVYEDIERFVERKSSVTHKRFYITAKTVEDRANQVEAFLRKL